MMNSEPSLKEHRILEDHDEFIEAIEFFREQGRKIVYTLGAYDIKHVGHERYFNKARECGDFLAVGIDSDGFITKTKGPGRPVVLFDERAEQVVNTRAVNIATILDSQEEADDLMKRMRPDVVVLSFSSAKDDLEQYRERMQQKYGPYCGEVKILPRQAETTTTARIRLVIINGAKKLLETMKDCSAKLKDAWDEFMGQEGKL